MSSVSSTGTSGNIIKCEGCDKVYKIHPEKLPSGITSFPCRACGTLIPIMQLQAESLPEDSAGQILIVVDEEELGKLIQRILESGAFKGHLAINGRAALKAIEKGAPDLILVSVYLPDMMGYELLDKVGEAVEDRRIPSILMSAVHHAARYKRAPTSLYGADDYVERHHLPDLLIPKIRRLLSPDVGSLPEVTPKNVPSPSDDQVLARRDLEKMERTGHNYETPQMGEIQRMCRVIAGDIALYNEDVIASTSPEKLLDAIASDLSEGEALLMSRFPEMEDQLSHLLRAEMLRMLSSRGIQVPREV